MLFVSFCNKKLKGDIADEKFTIQTLIDQQKKKIKTLRIRYNKPLGYVKGGVRQGFADAKQYMAECIAEQIIKYNILQIKEFDFYYEGSIDFVKSETIF